MAKGELVKYVTPVFRLSFPNLFEAKAMDAQSKPKFGCAAIWTPKVFTETDKVRWKAIMGALNAAALEKFKKPWKELPANIKRGVRNGAEKEGMEGYGEGTAFANLSTKMRPGVVGTEKDAEGKYLTISPEEGNADEIYPGCYCRATVTVYHYDNKGKGVALGLLNIQKVKDGERLDSRTNAADDFQDQDSEWLDQDEAAESAVDDENDPFA